MLHGFLGNTFKVFWRLEYAFTQLMRDSRPTGI